ncbi:Phage-related lysozyme (muraminidase) [Raoultella terrigena]|uniref:Phage-related lysozyme (Muraminidase) n=1 Tax=Raoultella terrigena TaxID=577 RepID=A0A3P8IWT8_RAOTE|nr:Phage-related lysozyme (muraminidase) [Raoultella terrigena]
MLQGAKVEWDDTDTSLRMTSRGRNYGLVTFLGGAQEGKKSKTSLQPGQQYWILVDKKNVIPAKGNATRPAWWRQLLPPFTQTMQFDSVICPTPYAIKAGDAVGHLGYSQAPTEGGYESRYQVHIECLSMDDNLETFLTNPEKVGQADPVWLKCPAGLLLYERNARTGEFKSQGRTSEGEAILKLGQVKTEQDAKKQDYYYLPFANGYVPADGKGVEKLSQYDFEKLGFKIIKDEPTTFDYLDGKTPPNGLVKRIFETLLVAAKADPRMSHRSVPFNYQRLLNKIESGDTPYSGSRISECNAKSVLP